MRIRILLYILAFTIFQSSFAQDKKPVTAKNWTYTFSENSVSTGDAVILKIEADVVSGWYMYGVKSECGEDFGPIMTEATLKLNGFTKAGNLVAKGAHMYEDDLFECSYEKFDEGEHVSFELPLKVTFAEDGVATLSGVVLYQTCTDGTCLSFKEKIPELKLTVKKKNNQGVTNNQSESSEKNNTNKKDSQKDQPTTSSSQNKDSSKTTTKPEVINVDQSQLNTSTGNVVVVTSNDADATCEIQRLPGFEDIIFNHVEEENENKNRFLELLYFFIVCFIAGFTALATPCVFPMIPMTVTFFTKGNDSKLQGITKAIIYGLSIIFIFTLIGVVVARFNGPGFATLLSTHWLVNAIFFLVFFVFALSFLGLFEITLPHSVVNKVDAQSDKGGLIGIFFMALTLVLVSFSCTGPIVGSILILSTGEDWLKPLIGMLGFSFAIALPFTLFALFPAALKRMPQSGGWLNAIKVTLGLLELALALKFLSKIDLIEEWNLLDRDFFLAIWIGIFTVMFLYLIGKIHFPHDSKFEKLGVFRGVLAIMVLSFVIYMLPGMWGAPVNMLSGILPPRHTQRFDLEEIIRQNTTEGNQICETPMYSDRFHPAQGINGYFDLRQAICCAKAQNKPILLDFTGIGCENCRKVEDNVWSDSRVRKLISDNYILLQLYGDAYKVKIPENERFMNQDGDLVDNVADQSVHLLSHYFGRYGQPYYILLGVDDENTLDGKITLNELVSPINYDVAKSVDNYSAFLEQGLEEYYTEDK